MIAGIAGALIGAGIGAAIWAAVAIFTGYEAGIVAWAIGGIVGFGATVLGGRGGAMGLICAILALVSIFAGKYIATKALIEKELRKMSAEFLTWDDYQEFLADAKAYAGVQTDEQRRAFMVEREFTDAASAEEITQEELELFKTHSEPDLVAASSNPPGFEDWKSDRQGLIEARLSTIPPRMIVEAVKEELGLLDIVFALLGIVTAFKVGATGLEVGGE